MDPDLKRWLDSIIEEDVVNEMIWNRTKPGRAWFVPDLALPPVEYQPISLLEIAYYLWKGGHTITAHELKQALASIMDPYLRRRS